MDGIIYRNSNLREAIIHTLNRVIVKSQLRFKDKIYIPYYNWFGNYHTIENKKRFGGVGFLVTNHLVSTLV